ncbi:hypothetical protein D3C76_102780 [compost metagenome]
MTPEDITPEQEGARLYHSGCMFSSIFGDVNERFVHDMEAMNRVGEGYMQAYREHTQKV